MLVVALHEHVHHAASHEHVDAMQVALHGHFHEHSPDHDHELAAHSSVVRIWSSAHSHVMAAQVHDFMGHGTASILPAASGLLKPRDHDPPFHLIHCVFLT